MIEQLKEIIDRQKKLDQEIFIKHNIKEYPLENMKIALFTELGELMNELPSLFKHWKQEPTDDMEKALIEYVDCLHFICSIAYAVGFDMKRVCSYESDVVKMASVQFNISELLEMIVLTDYYEDTYIYFFALGNKLGFSWEQIYKAYLKKNEINHNRQNEGY